MNLYIGSISGTSLDGIDTALVDFSTKVPKLIDHSYAPFDSSLRQEIRRSVHAGKISFEDLGRFDRAIAETTAETINTLIKNSGVDRASISAIGAHGQTLYHIPGQYSLQIGDPNILAYKTQLPVVADFRRMDIAAGGEGAPLAPLFHDYLFRDDAVDTVVVNMGGIANITLLPQDANKAIKGYDTGPANTLMDNWCLKHTDKTYDEDGRFARSGQIITQLLEALLEDPYFKMTPPKSTGPEYFSVAWLEANLRGDEKAEDVQATLLELTARSLTDAVQSHLDAGRLILCGGGAKNGYLVERIKTLLPTFDIKSSSACGIDSDWMEAMCFAWLAKLHVERTRVDLAPVTGSTTPIILGASYMPRVGGV